MSAWWTCASKRAGRRRRRGRRAWSVPRTAPSARSWRGCVTADDPDADSPLVPRSTRGPHLDSHDGGMLYVISRGDGPADPLLRTASRSRRACGRSSSTSLPAAGFRAVAFDSAGTASRPSGESGHSLDNLADDVRTRARGARPARRVLVGHSMGGMAVQAFASAIPTSPTSACAGIVLLSTSSRTP